MEKYDKRIYNANHRTSLSNIIAFYKEQVKRLCKIGVGNKTEFKTLVTDNLIEVTKKRLKELQDKKSKLARRIHEDGIK